jgi:hypothetical protein
MKVRCVHGYFFFEEDRTGQFSDFVNRFGLSILPNGDHFTFEALVGAPAMPSQETRISVHRPQSPTRVSHGIS